MPGIVSKTKKIKFKLTNGHYSQVSVNIFKKQLQGRNLSVEKYSLIFTILVHFLKNFIHLNLSSRTEKNQSHLRIRYLEIGYISNKGNAF